MLRLLVIAILGLCATPALAQTTQAALAAHIASLQAIVTAADNAPAVKTIAAQKATLEAQMTTLSTQLQGLNVQLAKAEGPDVAEARKELQQLQHPNPLSPFFTRPTPPIAAAVPAAPVKAAPIPAKPTPAAKGK